SSAPRPCGGLRCRGGGGWGRDRCRRVAPPPAGAGGPRGGKPPPPLRGRPPGAPPPPPPPPPPPRGGGPPPPPPPPPPRPPFPPFTSHEPRPYRRPSRTSGWNGGIVMPSVGTVSWWASKSNVLRGPGAS